MKRWKYGAGIIAESPQGTYYASVSIGHQQRKRKVLKTLAEAKNWITLTSSAHINLASSLDPSSISDYCKARELLPKSVTLTEAVKFWLDNHPEVVALKISEAWSLYESAIAEQRIALRPRTFASYRQAKNFLITSIGNVSISTLDRLTIENALKCKSPYARNGIIRSLSALFNFLVGERKIKVNPCEGIKQSKIVKGMPEAFSVDSVVNILRMAEEQFPDAVIGLALGFFAGLRPAEIDRLRPQDINNNFILVSPDTSKTSSVRTIPIRENLTHWLLKYPLPSNGCGECKIKPLRKAYVASGGIWYTDGARHSYASYAYALCKDAARVASEMGHRNTDMFFRHYRALANEEDAKRYFNILPN